MKRITLFIMSLLFVSVLFAEGTEVTTINKTNYAPDPNSGDVRPALNVYIAPSSYGLYSGSITTFVSYEMQLLDPNLTLGPELGFAFGGSMGSLNSSTFVVNAKATYYVDWLIPNFPEQLDLFVSSTAGFYTSMYSDGTSSGLNIDFADYIGGRWNFKENMSLYGLVGYGSAIASVGITFKF